MYNKFACVSVSFKSTIWFLVCVSGYLYLLLCSCLVVPPGNDIEENLPTAGDMEREPLEPVGLGVGLRCGVVARPAPPLPPESLLF